MFIFRLCLCTDTTFFLPESGPSFQEKAKPVLDPEEDATAPDFTVPVSLAALVVGILNVLLLLALAIWIHRRVTTRNNNVAEERTDKMTNIFSRSPWGFTTWSPRNSSYSDEELPGKEHTET